MSVTASEIPDVPVLRALGDRRSIRYFDPEREVERWKIETMLQAARFSSCQGNINATEAIVAQDWDFGPAIRARAEEVIARGDLPDYPEEMRETFARLMAEHGIDTSKYLGG